MANSTFTPDKSEKNYEYTFKGLVDREFELEVRTKFFHIKNRIKILAVAQQSRAKAAALSFSNEFLETKLYDVVKFLGDPSTTKEFAERLQNYSSDVGAVGGDRGENNNSSEGTTATTKDETEVKDQDLNKVTGLPATRTPKVNETLKKKLIQTGQNATVKFNLPKTDLRDQLTTPLSKMNIHPHQTPLFALGQRDGNVMPSTVKKTPRPVKPGEPVYTFSATGSPVIQPTTTTATVPPSGRSARVKLDGGNGHLIDVDLVYRGPVEDERKFGKIVTDFRGWAATRSAANSRRMLPSRVIVNKKRAMSLVRKSLKRK